MRANEPASSDNEDEELHVFALGRKNWKSAPMKCELTVDGKQLTMEIDTGAEVSIVAEETYKHCFPELTLSPSRVVLRTYTNQEIPVVGEAKVRVQHGDNAQQLRLVVVTGSGPSLLGRD